MRPTQTLSRLLVAATCAGLFATIPACVVSDGYYVPDEVVATTDPVYYDGVPVYWYGGHWMYRDAHGGWAYYQHEPPALAARRAAAPAARRYYGGGGYVSRGPAPAAHGGGGGRR